MNTIASNPLFKWFDDEVPAKSLDRFRMAFALVWLAYDVSDVAFNGTWSCMQPDQILSGAPSSIQKIQFALIALEVGLLVGWFPFAFALAAAYVRGVLAFEHFRLNDFLYYCVTAALLGVAYLDARPLPKPTHVQRWSMSVLRWQLGFIYMATAIMKLNPSWLSGAHLYVRLEYLKEAFHWPYPDFVMKCIESAPCASAHAWAAVIGEFTLGLLVVIGRTPRIALALAIAIHTFGTFATNVWFFSASMIVHVAFLGGAYRAPAKATA